MSRGIRGQEGQLCPFLVKNGVKLGVYGAWIDEIVVIFQYVRIFRRLIVEQLNLLVSFTASCKFRLIDKEVTQIVHRIGQQLRNSP